MMLPTDEHGGVILSDLAHGMNTAWLQSHAGYAEAQERIAELEALLARVLNLISDLKLVGVWGDLRADIQAAVE